MTLNKIMNTVVFFSLLGSVSTSAVFGQGLTKPELADKEAAKNANIVEAQKLNGEIKGPLKTATAKQKDEARQTANAVNQVPGVKVQAKDLIPPAEQPITGFHPIKKLLRPVENLEGMTIKLEQEIMKLEGPIASLQPPMIGLQHKMTGVEGQMGQMQGQLTGVEQQVVGVRSDLAEMHKQIADLQVPIKALQKPIVALQEPIIGVAKPLEAVQNQLNLVLLAIVAAAVAIAIGTPIAAVVIYKNRHKIFPNTPERDLPKLSA